MQPKGHGPMNLRSLHDTLAMMPPSVPLRFASGVGVAGMGSWRGNYAELTLYSCDDRRRPEPWTVGQLLAECREALGGKIYEGWKGGDYKMHESTPVWGDDWGDYTSIGVMGLALDGDTVVVATLDLSDYR